MRTKNFTQPSSRLLSLPSPTVAAHSRERTNLRQWLTGRPSWLLASLAALALMNCSSVLGQGQEVDDFQLVPGYKSISYDLGQDSNGTLYSVGRGYTPMGSSGVIRVSTDGGDHWATLAPSSSLNVNGFFTAFAGNPGVNGAIYVGTYAGQIYRSEDGGLSWEPDGVFEYPAGGGGILRRMTVASDGSVYAVGRAANSLVWVVRKRDQNGNWRTVDAISKSSLAWDVQCDPSGVVFVAGYVKDIWTVRRSKDGGATWSTVDSFRLVKGSNSRAQGIAFDSDGSVYVVGSTTLNRFVGDAWLVRRSDNGGVSWATVDTFQYANYPYTQAWAASVDHGRVYVGGGAYSNGSAAWLIREGTQPKSSSDWQICDEVDSFAAGDGVSAIRSLGNGTIIATGSLDMNDGSGSHWIIHKLPAPSSP
jgi:Beta-propeller repeat